MKLFLATIALALSSSAVAKPKNIDFRVQDIKAQLLYEQTGQLSEDITANTDFFAWNTIIGEGSAKENANDVLVTAVIIGPDQFNTTIPFVIEAKRKNGTKIGQRIIQNMLLEKNTLRSLILYNVGCEGTIVLTAKFGKSVRTEKIELPCGE